MDFWWRSSRSWQAWLLLPCAWLYRALLACRHLAFRFKLCHPYVAPVPVIVVGNFTVGGTGKTPLVIALTTYLQSQGLRVGIVSRGYGAQSTQYPVLVMPNSEPNWVGDEPLLIAKRTLRPVMIDPNRPRAIQTLLDHTPCDVIISDDGLQHLAMQPTISIVVIDGIRRFGNGLVLPAGPLREPLPSALHEKYLWVVNGEPQAPDEWPMQLQCDEVYDVHTANRKRLADFVGQKVVAIAGIGHPKRFFTMLQAQGIVVEVHAFPDHHVYTADDFKQFNSQLPWLMTEKDAVKCQAFVPSNSWVVPVDAELPEGFWQQLRQRLALPPI